MKKLIFLMAILCTTFNFVEAQRVGVPGGSIFNTNSNGGLLGHVQSNTASDLGNFSKQWVGIGQPIPGAYGTRIQWNNNAGILALTGTGSNKKLELNWSGPNKTANFEINQITSFTNPSGKINRFTIRTNGNVGIGTNVPAVRLDVRTTNATIARFVQSSPNGQNARIAIRGSRSACTTCNTAYIDFEDFDDNEGSGGSVYSLARVSAGMETISGKNGYLRFYTTRTGTQNERMRIKSNGNVGIGRTNPAYRLDVNGSARVTTIFVSSDERFKKDIKGIDNASDKINALNGLTYRFNNKKIGEHDFSKTTQEKQLGFMAQDVQKVFPELVSADEDGYLSVNYIGLIPVLVEALKEQEEVVNEQRKEITDLQTRMAKLEALLNASETIQGSLSTPTENATEGVVLRQNAPNPFNGSTTIEYQLPEGLVSASLVVSDLNGRTISTYTISGKGNIQFNAGGLENGIYTYAIIANGQSIAVEKMVIQK